MRALVFNPGSNSLKFEWIEVQPEQTFASAGTKLLSAAIENFGKPGHAATVSVRQGGETVRQEEREIADMTAATAAALDLFEDQPNRAMPEFFAVRVVHGGAHFDGPARWTPEVRRTVQSMEALAPLHNRSALAILDAAAPRLPGVPAAITLDTAFHRTLPELAWRYPLPRDLADRHGLRKYGFHGVSHRYLLERYCQLAGRGVEDATLVSLHLESGSSACAIRRGRSVDTSMGLTPLEGLMMGTRSGSVDPALVEVLMRMEEVDAHGALEILNHQSGLRGVGGELDTRVLAKRDDAAARLALAMFSRRVRAVIAGYAALLSGPAEGEPPSFHPDQPPAALVKGEGAEAILFGGGIGEDSPAIRATVCAGLESCGVVLDAEANAAAVSGEHRISAAGSRIAVWSLPSEEAMQIAHECAPLFA